MPRKRPFVGLFMPTQHFVPQCPVPSVSGPFSVGELGVAGAESRAIGICRCPTTIISFALTTHLLFTFTPEICGAEWAFTEAVARAGDDGHDNELLSPPFTEWMEENVVSYLVRAWLLAKRIFMLIFMLQRPATFLLLISLSNQMMNMLLVTHNSVIIRGKHSIQKIQ